MTLIWSAKSAQLGPKEFEQVIESLSKEYTPLLRPTLTFQAKLIGLDAGTLKRQVEFDESVPYRYISDDAFLFDAEVFTDDTSLYIAALALDLSKVRSLTVRALAETRQKKNIPYQLRLYFVSPEPDFEPFERFSASAAKSAQLDLIPYSNRSERFNSLKSEEGREAPSLPTEQEMNAMSALMAKPTRALALGIKSSGGLLMSDITKPLPKGTSREQAEEMYRSLKACGLVAPEAVVVCAKTNSQGARAPSKEALQEMSDHHGLKCSCGKPISEEDIEEASAITDFGKYMLDGSRWLTILVLRELLRLGVRLEDTLIEQQVGGDEIDCLADIGGDLIFFELKDKEFNLGEAYSFGAKMSIIRPDLSVIITTAKVGGDARSHFQRAESAESRRSRSDRYIVDADGEDSEHSTIKYIEGIESLRDGLEELASSMYSRRARLVLMRAFAFASLDGTEVLKTVTDRKGITSRGKTANSQPSTKKGSSPSAD